MKDKLKLIMAFIIVTLTSYGVENVPVLPTVAPPTGNNVFVGAESVDIDLNTNTLVSNEGVNIKEGNMEIKAFNVQKTDKQFIVKGKLKTLFTSSTGNLYLESLDGGNVTTDGQNGTFYRNYGFLNVGKITKAIYPNENIYFGGNKIVLKDGNIFIDNGWFTTDYNIQKTQDPKDAGYQLVAKRIKIEPDKQVTLKGIDFYNGDKKRTPFSFPFYRANIREGSKVPLFPEWGTNENYGFNTSVGILYGDRDSKFKGGFAPKYGDMMGLLIGRWENWYTTDNFGTAKLDIDDWLIAKKHKNDKNSTDEGEKIKFEERDKRYRVGYTHEYSGAFGKLYLNGTKSTYNMVKQLDDIIVDYGNNNRFKKGERPNLTNTMNFYSVDTDLSGGDITFKSKVKLTNDKKAYGLMVYDEIDDISYGSSVDHDLFSQVALYKDNGDYKIGGYYNYLYDIDPGSSFSDTQSRAENFGFEAIDKKTKIGFTYDEKNGNKFRKLGLWERDPNNEAKVSYDGYSDDLKFDYVPTMVKEYDFITSKDLKISFGEYRLPGGFKLKSGYNYTFEEKKLDLTNDSTRNGIEANNERDREFNRFYDVIYSKSEEKELYFDISDETIKVNVAGGESKNTFWDRTGMYAKGKYKEYVNDSKFYKVYLEKNEISLGNFGEIAVFGGLRYDKFDKNSDKTLKMDLGLRHIATLINNTGNSERTIDFVVKNDIETSLSKYKYQSGTKDMKSYRLKNKEDVYRVKDKVGITVGNTETEYTIEYKYGENPTTKKKSSQDIKNNIDFKIDGEKKVSLLYDEDRKYNDINVNNENYNAYTYRTYGATYYLDNHSFTYNKVQMNTQILDLDPALNGGLSIDNGKEKIDMNTYGYTYKFDDSYFNLGYSDATDRRHNEKTGQYEIDVKNQKYTAGLKLEKDKIVNSYNVAYETYEHREKSSYRTVNGKKYNFNNSDILTLNYEYQDKNLDEEDLREYAKLEYDKDDNSLSPEELSRIKSVLENSNNRDVEFNLNRDIYTRFNNISNFKRNLKLHLELEKNDAKYKQSGDYFSSLKKAKAGIFYSQNRHGISYEVEENSSWQNGYKDFKKDNREHKVSVITAIGKPSQAYTFKTYAKFYENLKDKQVMDERRKKALDGLGVELGKEMDYYKWSVAFERRYVLSARDYEWRGELQFTLLTFPEKNIFGLGAKTSVDKHTSPRASLFSGLKVDKVID